MPASKLSAALEALLFTYGENLKIKKLSDLTGSKPEAVKTALNELSDNLTARESGLVLLQADDSVKLVTRPDLAPIINRLIKDDFDPNLTPAALETLSIIAYLSPVSRATLDYIRGVSSSFILRSLLLRGLIERHTDPKRSYVYLYEPTFKLLEFLGIKSVTELPEYDAHRHLLISQAETDIAVDSIPSNITNS